MEPRSFAAAVTGQEVCEVSSLVFPEQYHLSFKTASSDCPFIRRITRRDGRPALLLKDSEISALAEPFRFTLVGKFGSRPPRFDVIKTHFDQLNLKGKWNIGFLDNKHLMIKLLLEDDYATIFSKRPHMIAGVFIKFLKWTPDFNFQAEPPFAPVWIRLPGLKLHFYNKQVLYSIAAAFGKPLKLDNPTFNLSRPSLARILVEMDITESFADEIWIGSNTNGYWQPVDVEFRPYYCTRCQMFGHTIDRCFIEHPELKHSAIEAQTDTNINIVPSSILDSPAEQAQGTNLNLNAVLNPGVSQKSAAIQVPSQSNPHSQPNNCLEPSSQLLTTNTPITSLFPVTGTVFPVLDSTEHQLDQFLLAGSVAAGGAPSDGIAGTPCLHSSNRSCTAPITVSTSPVTGNDSHVTGSITITEPIDLVSSTSMEHVTLNPEVFAAAYVHQASSVNAEATTAETFMEVLVTAEALLTSNSNAAAVSPTVLGKDIGIAGPSTVPHAAALPTKVEGLQAYNSNFPALPTTSVNATSNPIDHQPSAVPSTLLKIPPVPKFNDSSKLINQQMKATVVSTHSAASPSTLTKHAPVYTMQPNFHSNLNSEEGNTDSDSYETYTGSNIEEDLQLNDACKGILEEWQAEWEYQKSKKKQKGIRELKGLSINVGNSRKYLGSRRSLSGHL